MIGVYEPSKSDGCKVLPPFLLAFDLNTQKMVWGMPVRSPTESVLKEYSLKKAGKYLSLQFYGEKFLHFFHPETGEYAFCLDLPPGASSQGGDWFHITPNDDGYQIVNTKQIWRLIGGKITNQNWVPGFVIKMPPGFFRPLSTHCGFLEVFENELVLCGPTGDRATIPNCIEVEAQNDLLYTIEKHPSQADKCLLTIRTLKCNHEVVSDVKESILLKVENASFGKICTNGRFILFSKTLAGISPIFVDLNTQIVTYSPHRFPANAARVMNADLGELWVWDPRSKEIGKISSAGKTVMGSFSASSATSLVHIDSANRLYFVEKKSLPT
jgi:hypothetical protein